jgi:hypothetical protein
VHGHHRRAAALQFTAHPGLPAHAGGQRRGGLGLRRALDARAGHTQVLVLAGDGGTYDIGFQCLSSAAERNEDILYFCLDNEGYMNTGAQKSSSTPHFARTGSTPGGKTTRKKNLVEIMAAHGVPYAATASVGHLDDLRRKVAKAKAMTRPAPHHAADPLPGRLGTPGWPTTAAPGRCWEDARALAAWRLPGPGALPARCSPTSVRTAAGPAVPAETGVLLEGQDLHAWYGSSHVCRRGPTPAHVADYLHPAGAAARATGWTGTTCRRREVIARLRDDGIATVIVDRDHRRVAAHADRLLVLVKGRTALEGRASELAGTPPLLDLLGI